MKCEEVDRRLSEGQSAVDLQGVPEIRAHLSDCERCQSLLGWVQSPQPEIIEQGALNSRMSHLLKKDLIPVQPLPSNTILSSGLLVIAILVLAGFTGLMGRQGLELMTTRQRVLLFLPGLCVAISLGVVLLWSIRPGAPRRLSAASVLGALIVGYPVLALLLFPAGRPERLFADGVRCFVAGLVTASLSVGAASLLIRRGYSLNVKLSGAVLGGIGGFIAAVALQIFCPDQHSLHLAVWHGLTILVSVAGGALFGGRFIRA